MKKKTIILLYIISCLAGFSFEFLIGWLIKFISGQFLWVYPDSPLQTTSWMVIPLWGVAGLMFIGIGWAVNKLVKVEAK